MNTSPPLELAYCLCTQAINTALSIGYLAWREKVQLPAALPENYAPLKPSMRALQNWGPYIALAIPAIISYCMEGWACEVLIFFAGVLVCMCVWVGGCKNGCKASVCAVHCARTK